MPVSSRITKNPHTVKIVKPDGTMSKGKTYDFYYQALNKMCRMHTQLEHGQMFGYAVIIEDESGKEINRMEVA